jgi:hypothetical protein
VNAREMRVWLEDVPDDALIAVDLGDGEWIECEPGEKYPRVDALDMPPLLIIDTGMSVTDDAPYEAMVRRGY